MLFINLKLIIVSLSFVATLNGQSLFFYLLIYIIIFLIINLVCPQIWWPLSNSVSFLIEVMKGNNIISVNSINFVNDRISSPSNLNGVYIKGGNTANYVSFLTLPTDTYFSSTSFTITFWINVAIIPNVGKQARIIDFSDATNKANGIAACIRPASNPTNTAVYLESIKNGIAQTVSDTGPGFSAGWTHVAITVTTSGPTIATAIYYNGATTGITLFGSLTNLPAMTTSFTTNFIGKGTSPNVADVNLDAYLNDIKLFNFSLTATQVLAQYTAEKCKIYLLYCF
jgi:hypothetical protein